ncbi:MAG: hypothetical protein H6727_16670 [Myxococcales bacterium]|nr:hypothetical protein [Myxococcales bacterium]
MNQPATKKPSNEAFWSRPEAMYPPDETLYLYSDQEPQADVHTSALQKAFGQDLADLAARQDALEVAEVVEAVEETEDAPQEEADDTVEVTEEEAVETEEEPEEAEEEPAPPAKAEEKVAVKAVAKAEEKPAVVEEKATPSQEEKAKAPAVSAPKAAEEAKPVSGGVAAQGDLLDNLAGKRGPWLIFVSAFLIFGIFSGERFFRQSDNPHYVFLADALLKGRWHLTETPTHPVSGKVLDNDWAYLYIVKMKDGRELRGRFRGLYRGKHRFVDVKKRQMLLARKDISGWKRQYYVSFPPLPAFLMAGPMWVLGKMGLDRMRYNDTVFTLFFAALTLAFLFMLLQKLTEKGYSERTFVENALLTALFGFGTVFFFVAVQGTVWFTALTLGAFCCMGYLYFGLEARSPFLAGLFLGMGFLCRPLLLLAGVFFLIQLLHDREKGWKNPFSGEVLSKAVVFALPLLAVGLGMMYANTVRFGNPMEFGHLYLPAVYDRALQHGLFGWYWVPRNIYAFFLAPPQFVNKAPYVLFNAHGMSLFITTPLFLYLFFKRKHNSGALYMSLVLAALVVMLPAMFYQNTGWVTFGNRFSVDYTAFLVLLLAISNVKMDRTFMVLLSWGILINAFGALVFGRQFVINGKILTFFNNDYYSMNWIHQWLFKTFPWMR